MIVGVDEAGRGPLAGCVVAAAVYIKKDFSFYVGDSKEIAPQKREEIFAKLREHTLFSVALSTPSEIDKINILEATFLCFNRAIEGIIKKEPSLKKAKFIIDGNIFRTPLKINYSCIKGADKKIKSVSCASIIAKVVRDHFMRIADFLYPEWKFSLHKGYPTKQHRYLLEKNPLTFLHRRSFRPNQR